MRPTLTILLLAVLPAAADVAPGRWVEDRPEGATLEHPTVSMSDEEVTVFFWEDVVLVEAWYDMTNTGPSGQTPMMLPMYFIYPDRGPDEDFEPWVRISVNGEELETRAFLRPQFDEAGEWSATMVMALFRYDFPTGETTRLVASYMAPYVWWEDGGCFEYPLGTGGGWHSAIGHGTLYLCPGPGADWGLVEDFGQKALPEPTFDGETAAWEFTDLEPPPDTCYWLKVSGR
ncbi:MAG: hypothetical protein NTW26_04455 [bacterium]|nr:hypothetical protein [bacterium]